MGKRKYTFYVFQVYEGAAFAEYLEEMAAKGWMLKKLTTANIQCFERQEPRRLKFNVAVLPDSSEFESRDREEARTYREYCEEAGWKLVYGGTLWQVFYSEEEEPIPIETDFGLQLETQKGIALSLGTWVTMLFITAFFLFGIYFMLKEPGKALAFTSMTIQIPVLLGLAVVFPYELLSRVFWFRKAKKILEQTGKLPGVNLSWLKTRHMLSVAAVFVLLLVLMAVSGDTVWGGLLSLVRAMIRLSVCLLVLKWVREHGQGDRRENAIGYFVGAVVIGVLATTILMYPLERLLPKPPQQPEEYHRLEEFPMTFEELGFELDETYHKNSMRSWLSFYQVETGKKTDESGEVNRVHMTYYESPVPLVITATRWYYPIDHGNVWNVTKKQNEHDTGTLVTQYRYEQKPGHDWVQENKLQDTYLLSDRNRLWVLSYTEEVGPEEMERAIQAFAKERTEE